MVVDDRAMSWAQYFEYYGDDHHAARAWAHYPVAELNALRIVAVVGALVERDRDVDGVLDEVMAVWGVHPEVLVLRARRWLGWLDADRERQRRACELVGASWPTCEAEFERGRPFVWGWVYSPADRRPRVFPDEAWRVEWPGRRELPEPEPQRALPRPRRLELESAEAKARRWSGGGGGMRVRW